MTTYPPKKAPRADLRDGLALRPPDIPKAGASQAGKKRPPIKDLIRLALRNTRRHKARAMANVVGIALTVAALVFFLGFYRGTYEGMTFASVIDYATAHFQVQSESFDENDADTWVSATSLFDASEGDPVIEAERSGARSLSGRLITAAYAGDGARKAAVLLEGVDFEREKQTFRLANRLKEGEFGSGAVIGAKLAKNLNIELGDEIRLQARGADGAPNLDYWTVTGIFSSGYPPIDRGIVLVPLPEAQEFLGAPGKLNKVYVRASDRQAGARAAKVARRLLAGTTLSVRPWENFARSMVEDAKGDRVFFFVFIAILVLCSLSTVAGTMQMTVFERKREIGMMRACGWLRREIASLFTMEAIVIGIIGAVFGCLLGASLSLHFFPIKIDSMASTFDFPEMALTCQISGWDFLFAALVGTFTALLAGISPARRAAHTSILSALSER
jgi:putative ABC transport system permease protein